jgi:iron(III) transport system ATP-binding protein
VLLDGEIVATGQRSISPERRQVGMLFQDFALFPHLTVGQNVAFGLRGLETGKRRARVALLLERVRLADMADRYPHTLSGGQQQRVALARALAPGPRVMLLDEPFSDLDTRLREEVRDDALAILKETGTAVLMVTHDPSEAMAMGDRIAVMRAGEIVQIGTPDEVYERPRSPFVAETLGPVNRFSGTVEDGVVATPLGPIPARQIANGVTVVVLVRPEGIALERDAESEAPLPTGRVEQVRRIGAMSVIELVPEDGSAETRVRAIRFGAAEVDAGDIATIFVDSRHAFVFPLESE